LNADKLRLWSSKHRHRPLRRLVGVGEPGHAGAAWLGRARPCAWQRPRRPVQRASSRCRGKGLCSVHYVTVTVLLGQFGPNLPISPPLPSHTGNPPYSNLPYLPDGTGIRPVRVGSKRRSLTRLLGTGMVSSRAHMGRRVRCWSVVAPFDRGEHIKQRPAIVP